jgi:hypothetical protein
VNEPEIRMNRKLTSQLLRRNELFIYFTDGRGEKNFDNSDSISSKTRWDGDKLIVSGAAPVQGARTKLERIWSQTWNLSADGQQLVQTVVSRYSSNGSDAGVLPSRSEKKHIYLRAPLAGNVKQ